MLGSVVLDVAIGMVFVFLLLSLIATSIQELLSTFVQARPANLYRGLQSLFSGGKLKLGEESFTFVEKIYNHGLVRGLYRDARDGAKAEPVAPGWLLKLRGILRPWMGVGEVPSIAGVDDPHLLPAYIPSRTFALAMMDLLNPKKEPGPAGVDAVRNFLIEKNKEEPGNKAIEALLALTTDAGSSAAKLQANLENWYNDAMDRVSGWYRKNTQNVLLGIGLTLALVFNVDAVRVAETLWFDRDVRQSLVSAAGKVQVPASPESANCGTGQAGSDSKCVGAALQREEAELKNHVAVFQAVGGLPIGWGTYDAFPDPPQTLGSGTFAAVKWRILNVLATLMGWFLTAVAVSLGAPFWFDTLNKFMVVRGTVKPQEKSRNEGSKDAANASK